MGTRTTPPGDTACSYESSLRRRCAAYNRSAGDLKGYDCDLCHNKGRVAYVENGYEMLRDCRCMAMRRSLQRIQQSGLGDLLQRYTLERFQTLSPWQQRVKDCAQRFLREQSGAWFFIGGQVGCGKTHICTAIVGELLRRGKQARYMLWRDAVVALKASVTDEAAYGRQIGGYKRAQVLYIDDFLKTERGKNPSTGDIHLAYEILNHRYNDASKVTILSSELDIGRILDIDESVGSKVYQRAKGYCLCIGRDRRKNLRLPQGDA